MSTTPPPAVGGSDQQFRALLVQSREVPKGPERNTVLKRAYDLAKQEHYAAEPPPAAPDPLADLRRNCVLHLRMCELLELGELFNPVGLLSGFTRRIDDQMRRIYATGAIRRQPPPPPGIIPNGRTGQHGWIIEPAREVVRGVLLWCDAVRNEQARAGLIARVTDLQSDDATPNPSSPNEVGSSDSDAAPRRYTLGQLIDFLDGLERNREVQRVAQQEHFRRDSVGAALNATYAAALRWRPDEQETPGIHRIELLCDLEPGEAGINAAKVRRLRARICQQRKWRPPHADRLSLDQAADLLEGVQRATPDELQAVSQQQLHHGLATLDYIIVGPSEQIQVTGLSCKVIPGPVPTACPDANPVLPPSMIPLAEQAIRRLYPLPEGTTVHWVGHDTGVRNRCRCHPHAPFVAPFDRSRWAAVAPAAQGAPAEGSQPPAVEQPAPTSQTPTPQSPPFTVGDIRDLLVYQVRLVAHRSGLKSLNPAKVLATRWLPDLAPLETAAVVAALTPPEAPRLTEDVAWTLATYRRIAASARASNRDRPDDGDLMRLVGSVAANTGRAVAELLQMRDGDFDTLTEGHSLPVAGTRPPAGGATVAGRRPAEVGTLGVVSLRDHTGQAHAVPLAGCVYAGRAARPAYLAQTPERLCSGWIAGRLTAGRELELWTDPYGTWFVLDRACGEAEAINGDQLRDLRAYPIVTTTTTAPPGPAVALAPPAPAIDQAELAVLNVLRGRHPLLMKNVDIEAAAELSKQKVGEVVTGLIDKDLAARPQGERKGAGLTPEGVALLDRVRNSSADHP